MHKQRRVSLTSLEVRQLSYDPRVSVRLDRDPGVFDVKVSTANTRKASFYSPPRRTFGIQRRVLTCGGPDESGNSYEIFCEGTK